MHQKTPRSFYNLSPPLSIGTSSFLISQVQVSYEVSKKHYDHHLLKFFLLLFCFPQLISSLSGSLVCFLCTGVTPTFNMINFYLVKHGSSIDLWFLNPFVQIWRSQTKFSSISMKVQSFWFSIFGEGLVVLVVCFLLAILDSLLWFSHSHDMI